MLSSPPIIAFSIYILLSLERMQAYLFDGRFWAEEGKYYYAGIHQLPLIHGLLFERNGHIELLTNMVVALSVLAPLKYAPLTTTYLSFFLQCWPILLLIKQRENLGLTKLGLCALMIIVVGLPEASEVWANAINLHFHFALLAAIIAVLPVNEKHRAWYTVPLLAMAGMSGIPANFMVPVFCWLAMRDKNKVRWLQLATLCTTSVIQFVILYTNDFSAGHRDLLTSPVVYWQAIVSHQVISPMLEYPAAKWCTTLLREALQWDSRAIAFSILCSAPPLLLIWHAIFFKNVQQKVIVFSASTLAVMSIFTSVGDRFLSIAPVAGGRYFYAANVLVALYILSAFRYSNSYFLKAFWIWLLGASIMHTQHNFSGPDWFEAYNQAVDYNEKNIPIWPGGDWVVPNYYADTPRLPFLDYYQP